MGISIGMKDARLRIRGDKNNPLGLCFNCGRSLTDKGVSAAKEINSCGAKECNKECKTVFRWVRKVLNDLKRPQNTAYVNYQMGQGGL